MMAEPKTHTEFPRLTPEQQREARLFLNFFVPDPDKVDVEIEPDYDLGSEADRDL